MVTKETENHSSSEINMWNVWEKFSGISKHLEGDASTNQILTYIQEHCFLHDSNDNLLILGCGTGREGIIAAEQTDAHIRMLDSNGLLLARALQRVEKHRLTDRVSILHAQAEEIPLPNESVTTIMAQQVFSQVTSLRKTLKEANRVLKESGIMAVNEMLFSPQMPRFLKEELSQSIFVRGAHQVSEQYIKDLLEDSGFRLLDADIHRLNLFNQLSGYAATDGVTAHINAFYRGFTGTESREAMFNYHLPVQIAKYVPFMQRGIFYACKN